MGAATATQKRRCEAAKSGLVALITVFAPEDGIERCGLQKLVSQHGQPTLR